MTGALGIVLSQTVLSPAYEVLYSGAVSVARCAEVQARNACTFFYELSVGNTGRQVQEKVRITIPVDPQNLGVETRVADIVASAAPTPEPQIRQDSNSGSVVYTINSLMPNTLVSFSMRCLACTRAQLDAMQQAQVRIEARGSVSKADPRLSALQHGAMNLLRVVGLFY